MGINPYMSIGGYTIVFDYWKIKVITKEKIDVWEWIIMIPKGLVQFILSQQLPSPLEVTILTLNEEVWGLIDSIGFSPDEKSWFLLCKNLYYITK